MHPSQLKPSARLAGPLLFAVIFIACAAFLASQGLGEGMPRMAGWFALVTSLVQGSVVPVLYVLGAMGLGRPLVWGLGLGPWRGGPGNETAIGTGGLGSGHWVQLALGLSGALFLSHAMGVLGLLTGNDGATLVRAWAPVVVGLALLMDQLIRGTLRPERWPAAPAWFAVCAAPVAILFVAAVSPPGWLWESEFGAYDAMSYHLQLPKEWATPAPEGMGRLWPSEHNIYSFLPSYFEGAYLHVGAMTPQLEVMGTGQGVSASERLVGGEGIWLISCQILHALFGCAAAGLVGRAAVVMLARSGVATVVGARAVAVCGFLSAGVCLATPWFVVTGSLAYNELAMLAMLAGAALVAVEPVGEAGNPVAKMRPWARGIASGWLVGIACSVKPTALLLGAPTVGLLLLGAERPARWWILAGLGAFAGVVAMGPWLLRNELATGNPIFPFAHRLFGSGHWTADQLAVYAQNHGPEGSVADRLGLLFGAGAQEAGPESGAIRSAARGWRHEQWAWVPAIATIGLGICLTARPLRRWGGLLAVAMIAQMGAWVFFTHQQSRFLLPLLVPMAIATGLGAAAILMHLSPKTSTRRGPSSQGDRGERRASRMICAALALVPTATAAWTGVIFLSQHRGEPNARMVGGPGVMTGGALDPVLMGLAPAERRLMLTERAGPEVLVNLALHPGLVMPELLEPAGSAPGAAGASGLAARPAARPSWRAGRVYLLGDGAPLYFMDAVGGAATPVMYHTTWDRSPLGDAIRESPDSPDGAAWTESLRSAGFEFVLVNFSELTRLIEKDRYFDGAVTVDRVKRWLMPEGGGAGTNGVLPVRLWPEQSRGLYRLVSPAAGDRRGR